MFIAYMGPQPIRFQKEPFFFFFLLQAIAYLLIFPTVAFYLNNGNWIYSNYLVNELLAGMFFVIPLVVFYRFFNILWVPLNHNKNPLEKVYKISAHSTYIFCIFWIFFEILYLYEISGNNLIYRRIGTYVLAERLAGINHLALFIIRSRELIATAVIAFILVILLHTKILLSKSARRVLLVTAVFSTAVSVILSLLNSRGQMLSLLFFCIFSIILLSSPAFGLRKKLILVGAIGLLFLIGIYSTFVIANLRTVNYNLSSHFFSDLLDPTFSFQQDSTQQANHEWVNRFDCLNLITILEPNLEQQGYADGTAWVQPALVAVGPFLGIDVSKYKSAANTTAKTYLMANYTNLNSGDYPSCTLTDIYGNFGFISFIFAALFFALIFSLLKLIFLKTNNLRYIFFGLVFAWFLFPFEQEFITYLIGWIRYIPIVIILLFFIPSNKVVNNLLQNVKI